MWIQDKVRAWWRGKHIPALPPEIHEGEGGGRTIFIHSERYERHLSARAVSAVLRFIAREWRWLIPVLVAIAALFLRQPR
jgi:hypothetical protein